MRLQLWAYYGHAPPVTAAGADPDEHGSEIGRFFLSDPHSRAYILPSCIWVFFFPFLEACFAGVAGEVSLSPFDTTPTLN